MQPTRLSNLLLATLVIAALLVPALVFLTATPSRAIFEFSVRDEVELGEKFNLAVRAQLPIIEDPEIQGYIHDMAERIKAAMPPQPFNISAEVVRSNMLNAFAGPAGYTFFFSGLILEFEHESDLAGVMAHEFAHVSQRHLADRIKKSRIIGPASVIGAIAAAFLGGGQTGAALAIGAQAAGHSAMLSYSRENEREADQIGMNYLIRAGYNPMGLVRGFQVMRRKQWFAGRDIPTYLSTHPGLPERIEYLSSRVEAMPAEIRNRPEDDERFLRVKMLVRSRYTDTTLAMGYYDNTPQSEWTCIDRLGNAILLERLNRMTEARDRYEEALACAPNDSLFLREAGRFYFQTGDFNRAGEMLQKAVLINQRDAMALFYFARLLGERKQYPLALEYMERVRRQLPEDPDVRQHLGRLYGVSGNAFQGHLQLAYAALYRNDARQAEFQRQQAGRLASTDADKKALDEFAEAHTARAEFWR